MTARVELSYHAGQPAYWKVNRTIGDHCATWTYLTRKDAERMVDTVRAWPDEHRPTGWGLLGHVYDRESV